MTPRARTVSFKARRLAGKRLPSGAVGTAGIAWTRSRYGTSSQTGPSVEFGPSSLTINSHPTLAPDWPAGNLCEAWIQNNTSADPDITLTATDWSAWDTDTWTVTPPNAVVTDKLDPHSQGQWSSQGGNLRGCHNQGHLRARRRNGDTESGEHHHRGRPGPGANSRQPPASCQTRCTSSSARGRRLQTATSSGPSSPASAGPRPRASGR